MYPIGSFVAVRSNTEQSVVFDMEWNSPGFEQLPIYFVEVVQTFFNTEYYLVLLPQHLKDDYMFVLDEDELDRLKVDKKHLNKIALMLKSCSIGYRLSIDPYTNAIACKICKERYPYAEPNQPNNTMICWSCRNDPRFN